MRAKVIDCKFEKRETNRIHSYLYYANLFYTLCHAELSTATIGNDLGEFKSYYSLGYMSC